MKIKRCGLIRITIELPVNVGYDLLNSERIGKLFITAGPYLGYAFSGKRHFKDNDLGLNDDKLTFGSGTTDDMKPIDFGLNFGLGYQIPLGIYIRAQYGLGLANLYPLADYGALKNRMISVSIGYDFPLFKR